MDLKIYLSLSGSPVIQTKSGITNAAVLPEPERKNLSLFQSLFIVFVIVINLYYVSYK